jgi:hypothetical protein
MLPVPKLRAELHVWEYRHEKEKEIRIQGDRNTEERVKRQERLNKKGNGNGNTPYG